MKGKWLQALLCVRGGTDAVTRRCLVGLAQALLAAEMGEESEQRGGKEEEAKASGFWPTNMGNDSREMD
jgi:hypothetical protein